MDQSESEQSETAEDSDSSVDVGEVDGSSVTPVYGTPQEVSQDPLSSTTQWRHLIVKDRRPTDYFS